MDNNLFNPNINNPLPTPTVPTMPSSNRFINWFKSHKKLVIIILILLLVTGILLFNFAALKNRFFPKSNVALPFTNPTTNIQSASMMIKTAKTSYSMSEKIPVSIVATSNNIAITGFDTVIEYDPAFLTLSTRKPPALTDFSYFGKNTASLISVSAVQKTTSTSQIKLDNTTLFELEFTPKKAGKTTLKMIYMPGSVNDSNLIDSSSKDVLTNASGVEITIN